MAKSWTISLPSSEKDLIKWIEKMQVEGELSPSIVFRDAMIQKKDDWEMSQFDNPKILKKKIVNFQKTITQLTDYIESIGKYKEWQDFNLGNKNKNPAPVIKEGVKK